MHDVFGQVMLARRNENLRAVNLERTIGSRFSARFDEPKIGAALRLRQAHRAGPGAINHFWQIGAFQFIGGMGPQRIVGAVSQTRKQAKGKVGRADHFLNREVHR